VLTVTATARDRLAAKLARREASDEEAARLIRKAGHWRLRLDHVRPKDTEIIHKGKTVLLLGNTASRAMTNRTLDVKETETGPRLTLH
jgi:hypothetical protein